MEGIKINGYKWKWCCLCKCSYVECPMCGNNCCNGGTQNNCGCQKAYAEQDKAYKENYAPKLADFDPEGIRVSQDKLETFFKIFN